MTKDRLAALVAVRIFNWTYSLCIRETIFQISPYRKLLHKRVTLFVTGHFSCCFGEEIICDLTKRNSRITAFELFSFKWLCVSFVMHNFWVVSCRIRGECEWEWMWILSAFKMTWKGFSIHATAEQCADQTCKFKKYVRIGWPTVCSFVAFCSVSFLPWIKHFLFGNKRLFLTDFVTVFT